MTAEPDEAPLGLTAASSSRSARLTRATLAERGFVGFVPFADLPHSTVPAGEGICAVLRPRHLTPGLPHT